MQKSHKNTAKKTNTHRKLHTTTRRSPCRQVLRTTTRKMSTLPKKMDAAEITAALPSVPLWAKTEGVARDQIQRTFIFPDFLYASAFMFKTVKVAEKMCHHPEWFNVYNRVEVVLSTHDVGGLSKNDFQLAQELDKIALDVEAIPAQTLKKFMLELEHF